MGPALEGGIDYLHAGEALGGRPRDPHLYDPDGHVRYDLLAAASAFTAAIDRLLALTADRQVAVMCAEEDPPDATDGSSSAVRSRTAGCLSTPSAATAAVSPTRTSNVDNRPALACVGLSRPFSPAPDLAAVQWLQLNTLWPATLPG